MAKLKTWTEGSTIHLEHTCIARACSDTVLRTFDSDELINLVADDPKAHQIALARQAFRMMAAKVGLNLEPEWREVDLPLLCDEHAALISEEGIDHKGEDDVLEE